MDTSAGLVMHHFTVGSGAMQDTFDGGKSSMLSVLSTATCLSSRLSTVMIFM